jgi:hypothetical protein
MSIVRETFEDNLPSINGSGEVLATHLLQGRPIRYTDDRFQVSSNEGQFTLQLIQTKDKCVLVYAQSPSIYPLPNSLEESIKADLETYLKKTVNIEFVNAGTAAQRKDLLHSASMDASNIDFKHKITHVEARQCVAKTAEQYKHSLITAVAKDEKKSSFFGRFFKPKTEGVPGVEATSKIIPPTLKRK